MQLMKVAEGRCGIILQSKWKQTLLGVNPETLLTLYAKT